MFRIIGVLLCMACLLWSSPVKAREIIVSAAASLTDAFEEIRVEFEKDNPGVRVTGNYASSGALFRQIEQGAPVDVFASANMRWMEEAIGAGLIKKDQSLVFVYNQVVLAVPAGNPVNLAKPQDLRDALVRRVGITTPATSPAGNFSMTSLKDLGLWDSIEPKMIYAETVTQLMNYIQRGEVDAGFLFASDIVRAQGRVQEVSVLPLETPPAYPIAPLSGSKHPELAQKFVDLILSEKGQSIMEKYGFSRGN